MVLPRKIPRGKNFLAWPPAVIVLLMIALFLASGSFRIFSRYLEIRRERRVLDERAAELNAEKRRIEEALRSAGSKETVERMAKEKLNLKNPGEKVVVVIPPRPAASSDDTYFSNFFFFGGWLRGAIDFLRR